MTTLETDKGKRIPELVLCPSLFIDQTTVIYGPSRSGKTVITKNIMKMVNGHIEQILAVVPTEPSNRSYDGFIDPTLIHYQMHLPDPKDKRDNEQKSALRFLEMIYSRQEMMAAIYMRANSFETLESLYGRLGAAQKSEGDKYINELEQKRQRVVASIQRQYAHEPGRVESKEKEVDEMLKKMLKLIYKKFITPAVDKLWKKRDLTADERHSLHYLHFNPRLLLLFDDCAAQLKPLVNKDIFRKLFYQNRHSFITLIICCQDDTDLPPNLRKNAFISIFTEPIVCSSNFERGSNKFSKATKQYIEEAIPVVFKGFRKLAYIREDEKRQNFYHLTCNYPNLFVFGSTALAELCEAVRAEGTNMNQDNPFYERFRL